MIFNINNNNSMYELFLLTNYNGTLLASKYRSQLSNFLEILCVLKGLKPGYLGSNDNTLGYNIAQIKDLINEDGKKIQNFTYYPNTNLIVNNKILKNIDFDPNTISTSMYDKDDTIKLGKLLGYPCPGINFNSTNVKSISFNLNVSDTFRKLFNYTDKYKLQIIGFRCDYNYNDEIYLQLIMLKDQLDYYFNNILNFGKIYLEITNS